MAAENNRWGRGMESPAMKRLKSRADYCRGLEGDSQFDNFYDPPQEDFDTEEMRGSLQYILSKQLGQYVVAEFLIGTDCMTRKQGVLFHVGRSYVTIYDEAANNFIVCDIFSIKFVYFYMPGERPHTNYNQLPGANGNPRQR